MLSQKHSFHMDMTVLERQLARFKWLQQRQNYLNLNNSLESCSMPEFQGFFDHSSANRDIVDWKKKPEMYLGDDNLAKFGSFSIAGTEFAPNKMDSAWTEVAMCSLDRDHCLSRTSSCQKAVVEAAEMEEKVVVLEVAGQDVPMMEKMQSNHGNDSSNKRKAKSVAAEECKSKRIRGKIEVASKVKEESSAEISADSSKENQKTSQKTDYIHVRARRGQATDNHSLAERARREKISKKMKCLQDLVPGCNKIVGRAGMLDEIINYVQSLQRQVEFLSMKLAAVSPRLEFNTDNLSGKEFPAYVASFPTATLSSAVASLPQLELHLAQQVAMDSELEAIINPAQVSLEKPTSSSAFIPELCLDSACFSQVLCDADSQTLHNMGFPQG